jgi:hypothetical protein
MLALCFRLYCVHKNALTVSNTAAATIRQVGAYALTCHARAMHSCISSISSMEQLPPKSCLAECSRGVCVVPGREHHTCL